MLWDGVEPRIIRSRPLVLVIPVKPYKRGGAKMVIADDIEDNRNPF